ncbi:uncharacterized protein NECHADRAFT_77012 [Fusarium vanettenii 77-13-4]|uniref:NACHT-NTPase and P-loop NTPases N-terminal domain-containing protein n=1 Tax=Fusarium vanettenii (strain ATCC MYA-4622 / CBS 123669 / FGSC 9596 / NRRL 45880 / 77-13-4) TaxID=660122 RepID=C7ZCD2_FUSV7|nr:uncharacterized protein NECHADRAFT_77012 [Fusarium vanettenii 77-13-4]EEU38239.1 hypothetical protein NECHADRAFT_77012 [Fusarium vanettenii 77-13-4]
MAEVLGVVSSIIAIVGVAGKLGTSTFKLKRLWGEVQDVPTSIQQCIEQLEILAPVIQEMESEFERTREMVRNDTAAKRSLEYSQKAMETLEALIKDMEGRIESARRGKKLLTQLKQTYLIAVTRAQPSIIMAEWKNLQEQERVAQPSPVEYPDQDKDPASDATAIAEGSSNNAVLGYSNWWPTVKSMPRPKPGLLGSFTYRVEKEASGKSTYLTPRNVRVHQARLQLPRWILQKTWDFQFYRSYDGWKFQLKNWNIRPDDSPVFEFVVEGRTDLILELFNTNEASLYDVTEDGETLIELSMICRQYDVTKSLYALGLKANHIRAGDLFTFAMLWNYDLNDDEVKRKLLELCREGEEFSSLVDCPDPGVELSGTDITALLNFRFSCPEFDMFPLQQSTQIITDELRWDWIDPNTALDILAGGFARPDFLRKTNLEYFAWAYFHALLNEAQPDLWRLLTRELFAGADPEEVALPSCWSYGCWPLLCGTLAKIKWRSFPAGAFNKWLSKALSMWMEDLAEAGLDLQEYFRIELSACRGMAMQLRPGIRLLECGPSLVVLKYGDNPQDWIFEWDPCVEGEFGEFWNMIEFPPMPGAWVDEDSDGEDDDLNEDCHMGGSERCVFASIRYWAEMEASGAKPDSFDVKGIPKCGTFDTTWLWSSIISQSN